MSGRRPIAAALFAAIALFAAGLCAGPARADFEQGWQAYERGDYQAATAIWRPLAEAGDSNAQFNLGSLYYNGVGLPRDQAQAVEWWQRAAESGAPYAHEYLGILKLGGSVLPKDEAAAAAHLEAAAQGGLRRSRYVLGKMYEHGAGVPKDPVRAFSLIRQAAEQGSYRAQYSLGKMYRDGDGVAQDLAQSVHWFAQAAAQGYARAQNHLGVRYAKGLGVERDDVQALKWITFAAEQGDAEAMANRQALLLAMSTEQIEAAKRLIEAERKQYGRLSDDQAGEESVAEAMPSSLPVPKATAEGAALAPNAPPPPPPQPEAAGTGDHMVQIGAFRERERGDAWWNELRAAKGSLLDGLERELVPVHLGAQGTWYRLRVGPLAADAAGRLCTTLKSGGFDCFVVRR